MNVSFTQFVAFVMVMALAVPLREFGRALAADYSGDDIPDLQGRLTVEPWAHWDLWGAILIALGIFVPNFAIFGWGKPVLTDPTHYRNGRWGRVLVAGVGIVVNLLLAGIGAAIFRGFGLAATGGDPAYRDICHVFVLANISLAIFNLIPIPPLDGARFVVWLAPVRAGIWYERFMQGKGIILLYLIVFLASGALWGPVRTLTNLLLGI